MMKTLPDNLGVLHAILNYSQQEYLAWLDGPNAIWLYCILAQGCLLTDDKNTLRRSRVDFRGGFSRNGLEANQIIKR